MVEGLRDDGPGLQHRKLLRQWAVAGHEDGIWFVWMVVGMSGVFLALESDEAACQSRVAFYRWYFVIEASALVGVVWGLGRVDLRFYLTRRD